MNVRDYKVFEPGGYYHIYNRGNQKQIIFKEADDFRFFIVRLYEYLFGKVGSYNRGEYRRKELPPNSFSVVCYCLMPTHFHILIKQVSDFPVSNLILCLATSYAKYFNKKYNKVGHVWQDKFKYKPIKEEAYILWLSAYIHKNAETDRLVSDFRSYKWSSWSEYLKYDSFNICSEKNMIIDNFKKISDYERFVANCTFN